MDTFSMILLTLAFLLPAIALIWAISIFIWGVRTGGNWRNPVAMFEYFANLFFYRLNYNRKQRKRAYHQSVVKVHAAPDSVSALSGSENEFFFLHEVGLETGIELRVSEINAVCVTKAEYRKLQQYFNLSSKVSNPHAAFAHFGLDLQVADAAKRSRVQRTSGSEQV